MAMYRVEPAYPTTQHEKAARETTGFFSSLPGVEAVLLTCSTARGKATRDSCLDVTILARPETVAVERSDWEERWYAHYGGATVFEELRQVGLYSFVDLEFSDGVFRPGYHGHTSGPDEFELEVGNILAYSSPLWKGGSYLDELREHWLPYYAEHLREKRLEMVLHYCFNNLDHIPPYIERGLYFQSFRRLYDAFGEFLQALFISRRTYPIAYDKWVREQVEEILGLPKLYAKLPRLFEIQDFESREISERAADLRRLVEEYVL
jgi:predicted nucleotidyltransferase